jgi:DNA polymerase-3 subunit beta
MKIVCEQPALAGALALLGQIVEAKIPQPILACVRVGGGKGQITLTSHSLDRCMWAAIPAEVTDHASLCLPLAQLASIVQNSAKGSTVTMECDAQRTVVKIGRGRYQLPTLSADDFPALFAPEGEPLEISSGDFLDLMDGASYAVSDDDPSRPWLTGVHLYRKGNTIAAMGANGKILAQCNEPMVAGQKFTADIIIPPASVATFKKFCDGPLSIIMADNLISVTREDGAVYASKLLAGTYPDYERVIPDPIPPMGCIVARTELVNAIARLMAIMDRSNKGIGSAVTLSWADGAAEIGLSIHNTFNPLAEGNETVEAQTTGERTVKCQLDFLHTVVEHLDGEQIEIRIADNRSPIFLFSPTQEHARALIQPLVK